jgi:hypothetical protein
VIDESPRVLREPPARLVGKRLFPASSPA